MEYQTCPLAAGKSSTTFDEDAGLNRATHQMKAERWGEIIGIKWMCQCVDRLTTQLGKLVSICSMVLFNGTNKKVKCNMVIDWFTTNYMGAIMLLFLAVGEVLFWCLQIATVSSVVGGCLWPWSETHVGNSFASFGENPAGCYFLQLRNAELICSQVCLPIEWKIINYKSHYLNKNQFCVHRFGWNIRLCYVWKCRN